MELLKEHSIRNINTPVILFTGRGREEVAIESVRDITWMKTLDIGEPGSGSLFEILVISGIFRKVLGVGK